MNFSLKKSSTIFVSSQLVFHHNSFFIKICVATQLMFITVYVSLKYVFPHSFFFITVCVSSQLVFHHSFSFITICVSSQFVFHHTLCFITICVSSLCVGVQGDKGKFFTKSQDRPTIQKLDFYSCSGQLKKPAQIAYKFSKMQQKN